VGLLATVPMIHTFFANHYALPSGSPMTHWAITGLWLAVASFQVFIFAVMIQTLKAILSKWREAEQPAVAKRVPQKKTNGPCQLTHYGSAFRLGAAPTHSSETSLVTKCRATLKNPGRRRRREPRVRCRCSDHQ